LCIFPPRIAPSLRFSVLLTYKNKKRMIANLPTASGYVFDTMHTLIEEQKNLGRWRRSESLSATLHSFKAFRQGKDLPFAALTQSELMAYELWLKHKGLCRNTTSFYMRCLRTAYNRAAESGLTPQNLPFRGVYTGIDKTAKRALTLQAVHRIKELPLRPFSTDEWARDLFLFSLFTRGMAFVDMAFLKKKDLRRGILTYRRHKTGQQLVIKWEPCMQRIVSKYTGKSNKSDYLLPIIRHPQQPLRTQYQSSARKINRHLKDIGLRLNLPLPLTMYVARHTWASIAKSKNVSVSIISEAMGHHSERTTHIYLTSLDTSLVDDANKLILSSL